MKAGIAMLLAMACAVAIDARAQTTLPRLKEETRVAPRPADAPAYERARHLVELARQQLSDNVRLRRFARLGVRRPPGDLAPTDRVIALSADQEWPDETETSFIVAYDLANRPVALLESPVSESGDWSNEYTHFFDESGRTLAFQRTSSFFNGCPDGIGREQSTTYYSARGAVVARDYRLLEGGKGCVFYYRHPYTIRVNFAAASRAARLPAQAGTAAPEAAP